MSVGRPDVAGPSLGGVEVAAAQRGDVSGLRRGGERLAQARHAGEMPGDAGVGDVAKADVFGIQSQAWRHLRQVSRHPEAFGRIGCRGLETAEDLRQGLGALRHRQPAALVHARDVNAQTDWVGADGGGSVRCR